MRKLRPERQEPCLLPLSGARPRQAPAHQPLLKSLFSCSAVQLQGQPSEWWSQVQESG